MVRLGSGGHHGQREYEQETAFQHGIIFPLLKLFCHGAGPTVPSPPRTNNAWYLCELSTLRIECECGYPLSMVTKKEDKGGKKPSDNAVSFQSLPIRRVGRIERLREQIRVRALKKL